MNSDNWKKIEEIFNYAVELPRDEREGYLSDVCGDNVELREQVERLLKADEQAEDFIESPVPMSHITRLFETTVIETQSEILTGQVVGQYKLIHEIGRGGMGTVFMAERANQEFFQRVAIKLIKRGMDTDFILKRFRHERQILANLNHPNIARLLDGGTTSDGLPYFVMEYIEGKPVTRYCEERRLTIKERLKLFLRVSSAVQYAHENMVLHRDIKPANILVTKTGAPKLLDFGIAKLLDPDLAPNTIEPTATAMRLMTPEYASPEQVRGEEVSPAADVYGLGVLLYEILTGHRPYRFRSRLAHDVARVICEEEPIKPSLAVIKTEKSATGKNNETVLITPEVISHKRRTTIQELQQELRGDLDNIVLKSLIKEVDERYTSVEDFVNDINRHLEGLPVYAKPYFREKDPEINDSFSSAKSLAVLPFKFLSLDSKPDVSTDDNFLGIGLADALITRLSNIRSIAVRPTTSVLKFAAEDDDPISIGHLLEVSYVLDGRILKAGDSIRVTVQLVSVRDGAPLWASQFNERDRDILSLQDSIAAQVSQALVPQLTTEEQIRIARRGTDNAQAYEAYLRGRFHWHTFTEEGFAKSIVAYNEAIAHDSDYPLPYTAIAEYYAWLAIYGVLPPRECYMAAKEAATKALQLDNELSEAYSVLGLVSYLEYNWTEAENYFRRALKLSPNGSIAHVWFTSQLFSEGRFDEARVHGKRAIELDPLTPYTQYIFAWGLYFAGKFEECIERHRRTIATFPEYAPSYFGLSWVYRYLKRYEDAQHGLARARELSSNTLLYDFAQGQTYALAGEQDKAKSILNKLSELSSSRYVSPYHTALIYWFLGDKENALTFLEKAYDDQEAWLVWIEVEPLFDSLRSEPRFARLLELTKNPAYIRSKEAQIDTEKTNPIIAVLPFKLFSLSTKEDTDERFLGFGLADALITRISSVRRLIVRPTSSVMRYGEESSGSFTAGRELGADYVVDGHIQKSGDRVRISVQLLDVNKQSIIWAQRLDEKLSDVLTLEDKISEQVATSLIPQLTGDEREQLDKRGTNNPQAYQAYLRGRYFWTKFTPESLPKAIQAFQEAVTLDPNYALAHVGIADFYNWAGIFGIMPQEECHRQARAAAQRALELDESLGEALASLALVVVGRDWNWEEGEKIYKKALELNPNYPLTHEWYSAFLVGTGRFEEGMEQIKRSEELDPLTPRTISLVAWTFYQAGLFEEALAKADQIIELDKDFWQGHFQRGNALLELGRAEEAVQSLRHAKKLMPESEIALYALCHALVAVNRHNEAREILKRLENLAATTYVKSYFLAMANVALNQKESAFEFFEKTVREHDQWLIWFGTEPKLKSIRDDARYLKLLQRTKNPLAEKYKSVGKEEGGKTFALFGKCTGETKEEKETDEIVLKTDVESTEEIPVEISTSPDPKKEKSSSIPFYSRLPFPRWVVVGLCSVGLVFLLWFAYTKFWKAETGKVQRLTNNFSSDIYPKVSPDGEKVLFVSNRDGNSEVYVMNIDGSGVTRLTFNSTYEGYADWSSDGKKILVESGSVSGSTNDFWIMNADGSNQTKITNSEMRTSRPSLSPDGKQVVFASTKDGKGIYDFNIWVMNVDGSGLRKLTDYEEFDSDPAWSPDGKQISFTRATRPGAFDIMIMNADGTNQRNITNTSDIQETVAIWSPDGKRFAFARSLFDTRNNLEIWTMNTDGSDLKQITDNPAQDREPSWTPDGKRLVFQSIRDGNDEIYITNIDDNEASEKTKTNAQKTIAILPFTTDEKDEAAKTLSVGMTDSLVKKFSELKQLSVRRVMILQGKVLQEKKETESGSVSPNEEMYIISGELKRVGDSVQISAELKQHSDGKILWAEKFDQPFADIANLQSLIAERILQALMIQLTESEAAQFRKQYTKNNEAYQLYLAGRYHLGKRTQEGIKIAINNFEQSVKLDENFALAYAGLADCYALLNLYPPAPSDAFNRAKEYAMKAISLDDKFAEAHSSLAFVKFYADHDWSEAEKEFKRAIELNQSYATAHHWFAMLLATQGRFDEALAEIKKAQEIDTGSLTIKLAHGNILLYAGRYDDAIAQYQSVIMRDEGMVLAYRGTRRAYQLKDEHEKAKAELQRELAFVGGDEMQVYLGQAEVEATAGNKAEAETNLKKVLALPKNQQRNSAFTIATIYAVLNDRDNAFKWLTQAEADKRTELTFLKVHPALVNLRQDPRFAELLRKVKLSY